MHRLGVLLAPLLLAGCGSQHEKGGNTAYVPDYSWAAGPVGHEFWWQQSPFPSVGRMAPAARRLR